MILFRILRAIPFVILALVMGAGLGWVWQLPILASAIFTALMFAVMAGRTIWIERHAWNDMEARANDHGTSLWHL